MLLSRRQILESLNRGELVVEPLGQDQVNLVSVDLRLGTQFVNLVKSDEKRVQAFSSKLGDPVIISPSSGLLVSTLEYVGFSNGLAALLSPRSSLAREGIFMSSSTVQPGFRGMLVFPLFNMNSFPVELFPGRRSFLASVFQVEADDIPTDDERVELERHPFDLHAHGIEPAGEIEQLRALFAQQESDLKAAPHAGVDLRELLDRALTAEPTKKGRLLEDFAAVMVDSIAGLRTMGRNVRQRAEELDVLVENTIDAGFWRLLGSPIIVECKNLSRKVNSQAVTVLVAKLERLGPPPKTAFLIAPEGVTGTRNNDGWSLIREKRREGYQILVLTRKHLNEIALGKHASKVIQDAYDEFYFV